MKCPSCNAIIDQSYVDSFGGASSVSCPACGFMLDASQAGLLTTGTEFQAVSGWTVRLAKGQEVHFGNQDDFSMWLKRTTVTPGDLISRDGINWENLGNFLLGSRDRGELDASETGHTGYTVPPNTLDAPDPEDEFDELDRAMDAVDSDDETSDQILKTEVGHGRRTPPPLPGRATDAIASPGSPRTVEEPVGPEQDETLHLDPVTPEEIAAAQDFTVAEGIEVLPEHEIQREPLPTPPLEAAATDAAPNLSETDMAPSISGRSLQEAPTLISPNQPSQPSVVAPSPAPKSSNVGMVIWGLILGVALGVVGDRIFTEESGAERSIEVVRSTAESEQPLTLESREMLETAERWLTYYRLPSTSPEQLKVRLDNGKETTQGARLLRDALIIAAHKVDAMREAESTRFSQLSAQYERHLQTISAGPLHNVKLLGVGIALSKSPKPDASETAKVTQSAPKLALVDPKENSNVAKALVKTGSVEPLVSKKVDETSKAEEKPKKSVQKKIEPETPKPSKGTAERSDDKLKSKSRSNFRQLLKRGERALENGKLTEAKKALTEAADLRPKAHKPRVLIGYLELNRGNLDQALSAFRIASRLKPRDRQTLLGLGSVYEKQGKKDKARDAYERYQRFFTGPSDRRKIEYKLEKLAQ